jgi:hypothetical protein
VLFLEEYLPLLSRPSAVSVPLLSRLSAVILLAANGKLLAV